MRHRWVKLRIHVYICQKCGCGKVNSLEGKEWRVTFYLPNGREHIATRTPPCEIGPLTTRYLGHYAEEIAAAATPAEAHA